MKNKPLDRDYFKYKYKDKPKDVVTPMTPCCNQSVDHKVLNVNRKEDWKLIEDYIERQLVYYSSTESITPVSCKTCGRLLQYISKLKEDKSLWR